MRRWNGWGDEATIYPLPDPAARYLEDLAGPGCPSPDAPLEAVLAQVPPARLPAHPLVSSDPLERLLHARGQSLPDWIALRSGQVGLFPDGVAYPESDADVRSLLDYAGAVGARLIPYGGGTSVVGHINPLPGEAPVLTVDLSRLDQLLDLDETSRLATFGAGVPGPRLEAMLGEHGYTLGHFPQSFELSTLGGWIATRSSGQQSYYYGRIEGLFAGGHLETPLGPLDLPPFPASAAGPDLRQVALGSEGRLGIITRATVRISPRPRFEAFYGAFFPDWESGAAAVRRIAQERIPLSMARLSSPLETTTTLALSGRDRLSSIARGGLRLLGLGPEPSLLVYGVTGEAPRAAGARRQAEAIIRSQHGLPAGGLVGKMWRKSRFLAPYLRNTLWERGYALDTLETALPWSGVLPAAIAIQQALREAGHAAGIPVLAFAHLSHIYVDGASSYITFVFPRRLNFDETLHDWQSLKAAASAVVQANGGTISHQHGIGSDHAPYLPREKGPLGMAVLKAACQALDPQGILNPGKLFNQDR